MTRTDRINKIKRDLAELKGRLCRIEGEVFAGRRNADELMAELQQLENEKEKQDG